MAVDTSHSPVSAKPAHFTTIDPDHPYSQTLAVPDCTPCGALLWDALWNNGYQLAVVVSEQEFSTTTDAAPGPASPEPVLVVAQPLD
jgi:hypothetical protein